EFRGLRGHLAALRGGRVTTGLLKAGGGLALGAWIGSRLSPTAGVVLAAPLIALSANAMNLLDLRPLRALKLFWLLGAAMVWGGSPPLAQLLGLSVPYARLEAGRAVMLGDTGANALGGVLGVTA